MSKKPSRMDLRSVGDPCPVALLLVDVINDLDFKDGAKLKRPFQSMCTHLEKVMNIARRQKIPLIFVNDNFSKWRSDFREQVLHCLSEDCVTRKDVAKIAPQDSDYFVLKPKHSAFYASPLNFLLESLHTKTLVIAGLTVESCILFTAMDAYLREYEIVLLEDCSASFSPAIKKKTLTLMKGTLKAKVRRGANINFKALAQSRKGRKAST